MNVIEALYNAVRLPELRNKILFTGGLLVAFRLFANISIPNASQAALNNLFNSQALLGLLDLFSGGGLSNFSVVAMGINPYINASIIMQLMTVISERVKEISKEGEQGRRRITRWTRYLTVALALGQAYGYTVLFQNYNPPILDPNMDWFARLTIMLTMTAGTILAMWFGELITEYGIGNGISLVIFAGIIGRAPRTLISTFSAHSGGGGIADYIPFIVLAMLAVLAIAFVIYVQQAVRKIPIQSAQRLSGGRTVQGRQSFLPLKVNQAGVIPIIFAISIMTFPTIVAGYLQGTPTGTPWHSAALWVRDNFLPNGPNLTAVIAYNVLYFLFIFGFTYFYTGVTFDVNDVADNLRRTSQFIPGIRPGRPTAEYLGIVMSRVTFAGAIFLGLITVVLPLAAARVTNIPQQQMYLGGTALLIVVGVALDTMKQLETQLRMRQYRGFIR
ncbi:MAG TPA: preprotein translocase subunit SecY [Candidatus Dormibacteraeota bacterium]|nr:preprotein translocase subunit SecY [Candidatus Dormibacteraeota bacterium]